MPQKKGQQPVKTAEEMKSRMRALNAVLGGKEVKRNG